MTEPSRSLFEPVRLRGLKQRMRRFRRLRSAWYLLAQLRMYVLERAPAVRAEMTRQYSSRSDPWRYTSLPDERQRHGLALEMIDRWREWRRPGAFEVGCGEGLFTEALAPRCSSVLAVDIDELALGRAQARCASFDGVRTMRWDAIEDPTPGTFELVLCMDVMDLGWSPLVQRRAMRAVCRTIAPHGMLLVTAVLKSPVVEHARWARWLGSGGRGTVVRFAAQDRRLVLLEARATSKHFIALFEAAP